MHQQPATARQAKPAETAEAKPTPGTSRRKGRDLRPPVHFVCKSVNEAALIGSKQPAGETPNWKQRAARTGQMG
jgi:hypothetical protein